MRSREIRINNDLRRWRIHRYLGAYKPCLAMETLKGGDKELAIGRCHQATPYHRHRGGHRYTSRSTGNLASLRALRSSLASFKFTEPQACTLPAAVRRMNLQRIILNLDYAFSPDFTSLFFPFDQNFLNVKMTKRGKLLHSHSSLAFIFLPIFFRNCVWRV